MEYKKCSRCGVEKATTEFYKDKRTRSGLQSECKQCHTNDRLKWRAENTDEANRRLRDWRKANPEKRRAQEARYRAAHPEYIPAKHGARRLRVASGNFSKTDLEYVKNSQWFGGLLCYYCGCNIDDGYHVEHVHPLSRGGTNTVNNIVLACPSCNLSKGSMTLEEWKGGIQEISNG